MLTEEFHKSIDQEIVINYPRLLIIEIKPSVVSIAVGGACWCPCPKRIKPAQIGFGVEQMVKEVAAQ